MPKLKKKTKLINYRKQALVKKRKSHRVYFNVLRLKHLNLAKEKIRKEKKPKKKHTSWFKSFRWDLLKFDFTYLLGRSYYFLTSSFWLTISILILCHIDFSNIFKSVLTSILFALTIYAFISSLTTLIRNFYYGIRYKIFKNSIDDMARVNFLSGGPGCGKSSLSIVIVCLRAKIMWAKLKLKAFYYLHKNKDKLNSSQLQAYNETINAYSFYISHPDRIPCLWSNIPLEDYRGRKCFKLKKAHLFQKKRLPIYSVLFSDEIGNQFEAKKGNNEELKPVSKLARFIRHFFDGAWHVTEQEVSKTFVDIRRVSGSNKWLYQQKWIMKPIRLINLFNSLKAYALYHSSMMSLYKPNTSQYLYHERKSKKQSKFWTPILQFIMKLITHIGWRRYEYQELGNSESNTGAESKHGFIFVPSCLTAKYYDRAYIRMYEALELPLEDSEFTELALTSQDLEEMFPKEENKKQN